MADDRVEVKRGDTVISVVADQLEHWKNLGYTEASAPKRTTKRAKAGDQ